MISGGAGLAVGLIFGSLLIWPCSAAELSWSAIPPSVMHCDQLSRLESDLAFKHHERLAVLGTKRGKGQYRLYYSDRSGSWTMAWVDLNGRACVHLLGQHRPGFFGVGT